MVNMKDVYWLAGILEGEGCFYSHIKSKQLVIKLSMSDQDVVERAAKMFNTNARKERLDRRYDNPLQRYLIQISGYRAAGWMMLLYPLMGARRRGKIKECLNIWRATRCTASLAFRNPIARIA